MMNPSPTPMPPGFTEAELLHEVVAVPRGAVPPLPDLRRIERPGWMQIITPSIKTGGCNEVSLSVIDEADADVIIDATIAEYRRLGLKFRWCVYPDGKPVDLEERLARRGLDRAMARGMARVTSGFASEPDDAIVVEEVDELGLDRFTSVMAEGWGMDRAPLDVLQRHVFRQAVRRERHFLASHRGEPAGVGSYVAFERSAYLLNAVVLPRFRQKGLYRALVGARLRDAARRGLRLATTHAMEETSAPLLERMGFETVCRYAVMRG